MQWTYQRAICNIQRCQQIHGPCDWRNRIEIENDNKTKENIVSAQFK